ncbi:ATP-binding cassette sub-family G member 4 [Paracoccidioides lutzii Pb01]|uniref:ATP-binding cassette sub-family G member 4 n=1 Tax=Paracoccidioides lutzii (strain ATCC MYA-826 / Pb01) TaxID=502779 RepID=C1H7V1_PARBA|nr:ATP-binding cassette sub-family G member 4 [Paracoccidioides lutzii Pb01]EEH36424.2 ATP-binding cassette sub-family G member 4 [Paracoccidioides lutzii Pb01]
MSVDSNTIDPDLEANSGEHAFLKNHTVHSFAWKGVSVNVKDHETKKPKAILENVNGHVSPGELMVLMGPSGSGKTTLLNVLAHRDSAPGAEIQGDILVNGQKLSLETFRYISSYVEQEDVLVGALTVEETLHFAAQLSLPSSITKKERLERISSLLNAFGIQKQAKTLIGTPIRKGISGGQKRRVSVASQLITCPKILFLDEPTSGLDSTASFEVMSFVQKLAKKNNLIVIASVHQPSTATFETFDKLLVLSAGRTCYFGPGSEMKHYLDKSGHTMPLQMNPAEFILDLVNIDFVYDQDSAASQLAQIHMNWDNSEESLRVQTEIQKLANITEKQQIPSGSLSHAGALSNVMTLLHRSFIKSYRDVIAYGVRIIMYLGLAILVGTVWLRLGSGQANIQPFINSIFFASAFMSFMAVAYVPSFLEDRATFIKERSNGLYGPLSFVISNFIIGIPFLFLITIIFAIVSFWLVNYQNTATGFFTFVMWLFLDLLAAESLVVLIASLFPNFVIALALTAFTNGLWMCVGGFMVSPTVLNVFWRYVFHYIDYQAYVFQGMMVNEFATRTFECGPGCQCMFASELASECKIAGIGVLQSFGYATGRTGKWVGILLAITAVYRVFGWGALVLRKR